MSSILEDVHFLRATPFTLIGAVFPAAWIRFSSFKNQSRTAFDTSWTSFSGLFRRLCRTRQKQHNQSEAPKLPHSLRHLSHNMSVRFLRQNGSTRDSHSAKLIQGSGRLRNVGSAFDNSLLLRCQSAAELMLNGRRVFSLTSK